MTTTFHHQCEVLRLRLRELRRRAGLSGAELARRAGWHQTKVSKLERGQIRPSHADIRAWCQLCDAVDQIPDLIDSVENLHAAYEEQRKILGKGVPDRPRASEASRFIRVYSPFHIPEYLQTAEYASGLLHSFSVFSPTAGDVDAGVAATMEMQELLYRGGAAVPLRGGGASVGDHGGGCRCHAGATRLDCRRRVDRRRRDLVCEYSRSVRTAGGCGHGGGSEDPL
ncbi:Scr1 family TA system antitoxin-like transcriptional regulator [Nocardia sp. alder85J]|uniref:Scr1 family TA system antitoxin-like transcriptional regulator n=1 Tax=Nocardia sp. alder85J TaxID=2862949 RepID=UPI001CD35215